MKTYRAYERIQKNSMKFILTVKGNETTPVWVVACSFEPSGCNKGGLLCGRVCGEDTKRLPRLSGMRNQDIEHYLDRKSISVTLVFGSHEPIPSVCCTMTGTGPDPGHLVCS